MAKQVKFRRGSALEHNTFTGAEGEITVDTTTDTLRVHDATTVGGHPLVNTTRDQTVGGVKTFSGNALFNANVTLGDAGTDSTVLNSQLSAGGGVGSNGQVLYSRGANLSPVWAALPPGGISYTAVTSAITLVDKQGIIANTTAGSFTVTLPATPATGTQVWIADGGNWGVNPLTVARNGSTIEGLAENLILDLSGVEVQLIYSGTTWEVYSQAGASGGTFNTISQGNSSVVVTDTGTNGSVAINTEGQARVVVDSAGNVTLSQGTANGVLFLNGSKVVSSGSALSFDGANLVTKNVNLGLPGTGTNHGTETYNLSASNPGSFYQNLDYIANRHAWFVGVSALEGMRLTSVGLGIGTSSPIAISAGYATAHLASTNGGGVKFGTTATLNIGYAAGSAAGVEIGTQANLPFSIFTNNVTRATVDSSGNLGLGVTPSAWSGGRLGFQVGNVTSLGNDPNGAAIFGLNNYFNGASFIQTVGSVAPAQIAMDTTGIKFNLAPSGIAGNPISFSQAMTLTQGGNLLVGATTVPTGAIKLYLSDGTISSFYGYFAAGAENIGTFSNHPLAFLTNNAERARITAGGNLLVGTTSDRGYRVVAESQSPDVLAVVRQVDASVNPAGAALDIGALSGTTFAPGARLVGLTDGLTGLLAISTRSGGVLTERARITSGGYFKASNTGVYFAGGLVNAHEFRSTNTDSTVLATRTTDNANEGNYLSIHQTTFANAFHFEGRNNGISVYRVLANGNVQNTNNSYGAISDIKLKENITDATPKLEELNQLRVVNYNLKADESKLKQIGLIAQEVEEIFPGLVESTPDIDPETKEPTGEVTKAVKYSVLVPMMLKAIQELTAEVQALKAQISA